MSDDLPLHEVHPELFHYTPFGGLEGILRSQSLWGTHWQYLNDTGELQHFSEELPFLLKGARIAAAQECARHSDEFRAWTHSQGGIEHVVDAEVQGLVRAFRDSVVQPDPVRQIFEYYVTSFCTPEGSFEEIRNHGLLSMWRSYGDGGYALVFDTAELDRLLREEVREWPSKIFLGEVGYSCDPPDVLDSRVPALPELRKKFSESTFDSQESFESILEPLLGCFTHYKHWAYSEEHEVRVTTILNGEQMRAVHKEECTTWRERERYMERGAPRIHLFEGLGHKLPIKRIIVGPGSAQPKREADLRTLLNSLQLDIPVVLSNIPYAER